MENVFKYSNGPNELTGQMCIGHCGRNQSMTKQLCPGHRGGYLLVADHLLLNRISPNPLAETRIQQSAISVTTRNFRR